MMKMLLLITLMAIYLYIDILDYDWKFYRYPRRMIDHSFMKEFLYIDIFTKTETMNLALLNLHQQAQRTDFYWLSRVQCKLTVQSFKMLDFKHWNLQMQTLECRRGGKLCASKFEVQRNFTLMWNLNSTWYSTAQYCNHQN